MSTMPKEVGEVLAEMRRNAAPDVTSATIPGGVMRRWIDRIDDALSSESVGVNLIAVERARQVGVHGHSAEHDAGHTRGELSLAAWCYLTECWPFGGDPCEDEPPEAWPWEPEAWNPSADPLRNLVKACALIAAEIDRVEAAAS